MADSKTQAGVKKPRRPWRENLEAFGVAILMAVLLKPMIIEAYQIPTPSMQPTLMGSVEANVHDRILVDKIRYELFEPKRWDITVFRYPIRRNQNYVKRIVGVGGDRLRIAGGNLYSVDGEGSVDGIFRKPERIQGGLWKQIYPARRELNEMAKVLGDFFVGRSGDWSEQDGALVCEPSRGRARISYIDRAFEGITNRVFDGYPAEVAKAIRDADSGGAAEGVQDVRIAFGLTPEKAVKEMSVEIKLAPAGHDEHKLRWEVTDGQGVLRIVVGDEERARSEGFAVSVPAGSSTAMQFAHIDDRLIAHLNGTQVGELEIGDHRVTSALDGRSVSITVETRDGGSQKLTDLTVDRDLHYVPQGLDDPNDHVIEVPEGHFFMMGDNTLASADSRQWKVFDIGVTDDGMVVDPGKHPEARKMSGNRRPWPLSVKPDVDENPVVLRSSSTETHDEIAFTDDEGEVHYLRGKVGANYGGDGIEFVELGGSLPHHWKPEERHVYFVPREHILGRPVATFWPLDRIGFIR